MDGRHKAGHDARGAEIQKTTGIAIRAADFVEKIRNIVSFLQEIESIEELKLIVAWRAHQLSGDRKRTWSVTVTRNWRITFRTDDTDKAIVDLDFEDYH